ncbi:MAG: GH39 family glycosyl hydrolase [Novosphingobium sp.]
MARPRRRACAFRPPALAPCGCGTAIRLGRAWSRSRAKGQFGLLDRFVAAATPGQAIILTLGQSPTWASSDPARETFYGAGATAPPKNLADWTNYIKVVAKRYKGRIQYYEVWNEPNDPTFYSGTVAQIAALTKAARAALKAVDPAAKVITAPAYSPGYLDQYLATGAAKYADIIGYHVYATPPEEAARQLGNVRLVLARHRLTGMPLWDTEGGSGDSSTPPALARTYIARKYLADLASGAANFGWYGWGPATPYAVGTTEYDTRVQTPAAKAFAVVRGWLVDATVVSGRVDAAGTWRLALTLPGGGKALVLWNPDATTRFVLPASFRGGTLHDLDGKMRALTADTFDLTYAPVMISAP